VVNPSVTAAVDPPRSSHARASRIAILGLLLAGAVSVLIERDAPVDPGLTDLDLAIPVPASARLVDRGIERGSGRSISVFDVDPTTPPCWNDVYVVTRRRDLPGVFVSHATEPVDLPGASASIDEWRAFAAGAAVRLEPHVDLRSVAAALGDRDD
jgi:hypothetical protein